MTEGDKYRLKKAGYNFMDITDHPNLGQINHQRGLANAVSLDNPIDDKTKSSIKAMMTGLDDKHLRADIAKLSSFWNRNYKSHWGLSSSDWIHDQVEAVRY
jgi:leucyl aminopeptidase